MGPVHRGRCTQHRPPSPPLAPSPSRHRAAPWCPRVGGDRRHPRIGGRHVTRAAASSRRYNVDGRGGRGRASCARCGNQRQRPPPPWQAAPVVASWGNVGGVGALRAVGGNVGGASQKGFFFCLPEVLRKGWRGVRAFLVGPPVALATAVVAPPFFFFLLSWLSPPPDGSVCRRWGPCEASATGGGGGGGGDTESSAVLDVAGRGGCAGGGRTGRGSQRGEGASPGGSPQRAFLLARAHVGGKRRRRGARVVLPVQVTCGPVSGGDGGVLRWWWRAAVAAAPVALIRVASIGRPLCRSTPLFFSPGRGLRAGGTTPFPHPPPPPLPLCPALVLPERVRLLRSRGTRDTPSLPSRLFLVWCVMPHWRGGVKAKCAPARSPQRGPRGDWDPAAAVRGPAGGGGESWRGQRVFA